MADKFGTCLSHDKAPWLFYFLDRIVKPTVDQYFHPGCGSFPRRPVHICLIRVIFCILPIKSRVTLGCANPLTPLKVHSMHDPTGSAVHTHSKILTTATHDTTSSCVQNSKILFHKSEIHSHQTHKKRLRSQHFCLHNGLLVILEQERGEEFYNFPTENLIPFGHCQRSERVVG